MNRPPGSSHPAREYADEDGTSEIRQMSAPPQLQPVWYRRGVWIGLNIDLILSMHINLDFSTECDHTENRSEVVWEG